MAALTGLLIADSYKALLKTVDNDVLGATAKEIVDGYGNVSGVLFDTSGNVTINGNFRALDAILDSSGSPGTAGQVLTTTGTTTQWQSLSSVSGVTGSGTAGYLPLWSTGSVLTNSIATQSGTTITVGGTLNVNTRINTPILQLTGGTGNQGTLSWNVDEETVDLIQNGATLQVGQELQIHCKNQTGATIPDGTPVYVTGTLGASGRLTIAPMIADGSIPAKYFIGITTEAIANGDDGKVTTFGKIRGLNTAAYTEGQTLWVSATTAGAFVTTRPAAPNLDLEVAIVINSHVNNGTLFVRSSIGHYLGTAHDVNISSVAENDLLVYKTNRWVNSKSIGDLSAANVTLTGYLRGPATFVIDPAAHGDETGLVQILGDLRVDGTTTTINSTTISVSDKNITLAKDAATAGDANGAGITIAGASATLTYLSASDDFTFNKNVNASRFVGPLTGDVTGTVSDLSNHDTDDLAEGLTNLYFTTTRARAAFSAGTGVSIASGVISIGQSVGTTDNVTFGTVTASLSGNADTASALATARNIALDGSVTGNADFDGSGNITITTTTNHNHDDRYYTETESDAKYLLNTTDTLDGNLTVTGDLIVTGGIDLSNADLDIGSADIIFGTTAGGATRGLIWDVSGSGFLSKLIGGGADGGKVTLFANMDDAITTGNIFEIKDGSTGSLFLGLSHAGILTAGGGTSTQWNSAYTLLNSGDSPFYGLLYSSLGGDLNTYNLPGIYSAEYTGTTNRPLSQNGHFIQISDAGGSDVKTQFYYASAGDRLFTRVQWGNGDWKSWRELIHDGNIGSQSVNYAASAGNAGTLDNIDSSQFLRSDESDTMNGNLDITGRIKLGGYSYIGEDLSENDSLTIACDSTESLHFAQYTIATDTYSTKMILNPSGYLGINILNPADYLHISGTNDFSRGIRFSEDDGDYLSKITFSSEGGANSNWGLNFYTPSGETTQVLNMALRGNGRVGIATDSPSNILHVKGSGAVINSQATAAVGSNYFLFSNNANEAKGYVGYGSGGNDTLYLTQQVTDSDIAFYNGGGVKAIIKPGGQFGVGTTDPQTSIQIGDYTTTGGGVTGLGLTFAAQAGGSTYINFFDNNNTQGTYIRAIGENNGGSLRLGARWDDYEDKMIIKMYQTSAGASYNIRMGLNTTDPTDTLHVNGTAKINSNFIAGDSKFYNSVQLTDSLGGTTQGWIWTSSPNELNLGVGSVSAENIKFSVLSNGHSRIYGAQQLQFFNSNVYINSPDGNDLNLAAYDDINLYSRYIRLHNGATEYARFSDNSSNWINIPSTAGIGGIAIGHSQPEAMVDIRRSHLYTAHALIAANTNKSINMGTYDTAIIQADDVTTLRIVERNGGTDDQLMTLAIGDGYGRISTTGQPLQFYVNGSPTAYGYNGLDGTLALALELSGRAYFTNNVGIGSSANSARLSVYAPANEWTGDYYGSGTSGQSYGVVVRAGTTADDYNFYALDASSNTPFFAIKGNGNIGVGTSSPYANLDLGSSGENNIILRNTANAYNLGYIGNAGGRISIGFSDSNGSLVPLPYLSVFSNGSVSIGNTNSTSQLDVTSNGGANGITIRNRVSDDYAFLNWRNHSGGELLAEQYIQRTAANTAVMRYTISNGGSPSTYLAIASTGAATFSGQIIANAINGAIWVNGSGYTLNPSSMLIGLYTSSRGYIQVPDSGQFEIWTAGTSEIATFKNNKEAIFYGSVAIGVTSPDAKLHVKGIYNTAILQTTASTGSNYLEFKNNSNSTMGYVGYGSSGNNTLYLTQLSDASISFYNGGSVRAVIKTDGYFGIGSTDPSSRLTIYDSSNTTTGQQIRLGLSSAFDYTMGRNPNTGYLDFGGYNSAGDVYLGAHFQVPIKGGQRGNQNIVRDGLTLYLDFNDRACVGNQGSSTPGITSLSTINYQIDYYGGANFEIKDGLGTMFFDNSADYLIVRSFYATTSNTYELWINSTAWGVGGSVWDTIWDSGNERPLLGFQNGLPTFYPDGPAGSALSTGKWYQVVFAVNNDDDYDVYINGYKIADGINYSNNQRTGTFDAWIGGDNGTESFYGHIGIVRHYNRQLTAQEVLINYNADVQRFANITPQLGTFVQNGNLYAGGDVIAYYSSDKQLKDNIKPISNAIEKVKSIGGYEFDWNDKQTAYKGHDIGVIAQDVEAVIPELVTTRESGYKAVKYEKLTALLIEAVKEQQKQIDELKAIINGSTK